MDRCRPVLRSLWFSHLERPLRGDLSHAGHPAPSLLAAPRSAHLACLLRGVWRLRSRPRRAGCIASRAIAALEASAERVLRTELRAGSTALAALLEPCHRRALLSGAARLADV